MIHKKIREQLDGAVESSYLVATIAVFGALALLLPNVFPSILRGIWRWIVKLERWWGW